VLLIGERINTARDTVRAAVEARDAGAVEAEAIAQRDAGAHYLDVNCGSVTAEEEPELLAWLVRTAQGASGLPLCVDSPNPAALAAGLAAHEGKALVNSISGEEARYATVLPLVKEHGSSVVALGMDDRGIPADGFPAFDVGAALVERLLADGLDVGDVYFDPLVRSLGTNPESIAATLDLMARLGGRFPGLHFVTGLSNVSYGLPERRHINRAFAVLSVANGLDAVILDPLDRVLTALLFASEALAGRDRFSLRYIQAYKEGRLGV